MPTIVTPPAANQQSTSDQESLSSGAEAGIGVGVPLGVCALVLVGFLFFRRSRKRKSTRDEGTPGWRTPELSNEPMEVKELSDVTRRVQELSNDAMETPGLPTGPRPERAEHYAI